MRFSIRSKLIIGYVTLLVSVAVAAFYGYYSLSKVVKGKKTIRFYTENVILSNRIYQYMSEARQARLRFISSLDFHLAREVKQKIRRLQSVAKELEVLAVQIRDPDQLEMARAIYESAVVYLETFQSLERSIRRRGAPGKGGILGRLQKVRNRISGRLPVELILRMNLLENKKEILLSDVIAQRGNPNFFTVFSVYGKSTGNSEIITSLEEYHTLYKRLYFENLNIQDLMPLMRLNAEMIDLFIIDNVVTAEKELEAQFERTEELEQRQKIVSLLVTFITISAGLLAVIVFGTEALDLSRLNQEQSAILEAIRDGIVAVNRDAKVTLINQRAKDLLGLKSDYLGKHILELFPSSKLPEVMKTGIPQFDQEQQRGKITVLTTRIPVIYKNSIIGGIVCFRRKEELSKLAGKLTQVNAYIDALRANNHEFKNRLQTIQGMIQLGKTDEVLSFIQTLHKTHQKRISLYVGNIEDPAISAILLGKYNKANELGISMELSEDSNLTKLPSHFDPNGLVSIIGNLVQNAIDAVRELKHQRKEINVTVKEFSDSIYFAVADNGPGIPAEIADRIFTRGFTTKQTLDPFESIDSGKPAEKHIGMGLYIARNYVISMGGSIQYKTENGAMFEVTLPKTEDKNDHV